MQRVKAAAERAGIEIDILEMPDSTRTASEAASACGCDVGQIVKSLVFEGADSAELVLILVSGSNQVDLDHVASILGEPLARADPKRIREQTGFAIGGVAPIGHLNPVRCLMDRSLLDHAVIWAAAGAPNAVFSVEPQALVQLAGPEIIAVGAWAESHWLADCSCV